VKWTIGTLLFSNVLALILAVILRSRRIYFGMFFRVLFFLPVTMSFVATGVMFQFILSPEFGAVDQVFRFFGFAHGPDLLGNPSTALYVLLAVSGWATFGLAVLLFDAGLTQIPHELYESARLDGANALEQFRFVTFPMLKPISMIIAVLAVLEALRAFDLPYAMTRGGPAQATTTLGYFMWVDAFDEQRFGYGSAISTVILLFSVIFAVVYIRRAGRDALGEHTA
jgi:multiple sugar transport system permease protein